MHAQLKDHVGSEELIQVRRRSGGGVYTGFALGLGTDWLLMAAVTDGGFFNGYRAHRLRDIRSVRADGGFQTRFARTRPEWPPSLPDRMTPIDLDSTEGMLRSLLRADELVGIESDHRYETLWIGIPDEILGRRWLSLWEVDTAAVWHDRPRCYRIRRIVSVCIGDQYQRALGAMVEWPAPVDQEAPAWPEKRPRRGRRQSAGKRNPHT